MVFEFLESLDMEDRFRVRAFSWSAGLFFAIAWWIFIDACVMNGYYHDTLGIKAQLVLIPVGSTVGFSIVAFMDQSSLNADEYSHRGGKLVRLQARALFSFAVILLFFCIAISIHVLKHVYLNKYGIKGDIPESNYVGWSLVVGSFCYLMAAILVKVGRVSDEFV